MHPGNCDGMEIHHSGFLHRIKRRASPRTLRRTRIVRVDGLASAEATLGWLNPHGVEGNRGRAWNRNRSQTRAPAIYGSLGTMHTYTANGCQIHQLHLQLGWSRNLHPISATQPSSPHILRTQQDKSLLHHPLKVQMLPHQLRPVASILGRKDQEPAVWP